MVEVYTSTIHDYNGPNKLDITVKGNDPIGRTFAPTWEMVNGYLKHTLSKEAYAEQYYDMMLSSFQNTPTSYVWQELLSRDAVVLCCYCPPSKFCHRHLLTHYLVKLGAIFRGEL